MFKNYFYKFMTIFAVILFAGDSGDGIQLTGAQFSQTVAFFGNDLNTLPDFPAEIRAEGIRLAKIKAVSVDKE